MKKKYIQPVIREHKLRLNPYMQSFSDNTINDGTGIPKTGDDEEPAAKGNFFSDWDEE